MKAAERQHRQNRTTMIPEQAHVECPGCAHLFQSTSERLMTFLDHITTLQQWCTVICITMWKVKMADAECGRVQLPELCPKSTPQLSNAIQNAYCFTVSHPENIISQLQGNHLLKALSLLGGWQHSPQPMSIIHDHGNQLLLCTSACSLWSMSSWESSSAPEYK